MPRDLETYCLKCLEKAPEKRFATAAELAEELRRYMDRRSIKSWPVGRVERLARWCRRNPALAGTGSALVIALVLFAVGGMLAAVHQAKLKNGAKKLADDMAKLAEDMADLAEKERASRMYAEQQLYYSQVNPRPEILKAVDTTRPMPFLPPALSTYVAGKQIFCPSSLRRTPLRFADTLAP